MLGSVVVVVVTVANVGGGGRWTSGGVETLFFKLKNGGDDFVVCGFLFAQ